MIFQSKFFEGENILIDYGNELNAQLLEVRSLRKEAEKRVNKYKNMEPGTLRVTKSHGRPQYYFRSDKADKGKYISIDELDKIKIYAQKEYDEKILRQLTILEKRLETFLKGYIVEKINSSYCDMCDTRKSLIEPLIPSRESMIRKWLEENKGEMNECDKEHSFKTMRGEFVRSKSEKILADYFWNSNIPYQYEPCFEMSNYRNVNPDFIILNVRKNKNIYWEHLGLVSEEWYASKNFLKIMDYEDSGLIIGDNLIITLETPERPLDIKLVEDKVNTFIL